MMIKRLTQCVTGFSVAVQPALLLVLRVLTGFCFYNTGHGKLAHLPNTAAFFAELGIPAPYAQAAFVGGLEMIGGLLLVAGLLSRPIALLLSGTMIVALLTAHRAATLGMFSDPNEFIGQAPVPFLMTTLVILAFGAGKLSLDALLGRWAKSHCAMCHAAIRGQNAEIPNA